MKESQAKNFLKQLVYQISKQLSIPIVWDTPNDRLVKGKPDIIIFTSEKPIFIEVKTNSKKYGFTQEQKAYGSMLKKINQKIIGIEWRDKDVILYYPDITIREFEVISLAELSAYLSIELRKAVNKEVNK